MSNNVEGGSTQWVTRRDETRLLRQGGRGYVKGDSTSNEYNGSGGRGVWWLKVSFRWKRPQ